MRYRRQNLWNPVETLAWLIATIPRRWTYSIVIGATLAVFGAAFRAGLGTVLGPHYPIVTFFLAVLLAAVLGGYGAGFTAVIVSTLISFWAFAQPQFSIDLKSNADLTAISIFVITGSLDALIAGSLRRALVLAQEREARLKLMVDELNHRVKNTLATVSSISAQSLRTATSLDGFKEAFQQRLQALSNTHNLLNRTFWAGVSLGDLVRQATAPYATEAEGRVSIEGEDLRLGPVAAVTLGIGLHELANNAAKYGALSAPSGRVRVTWRPSGPGRLKLDWEELEGPPVQPPSRRGFGSELIEKVLAAELHGEVRLEFPPQGVRCTMDMELNRVCAH
jgi:two-component sensor histidine kinase